jgi:hypothetical protein
VAREVLIRIERRKLAEPMLRPYGESMSSASLLVGGTVLAVALGYRLGRGQRASVYSPPPQRGFSISDFLDSWEPSAVTAGAGDGCRRA